MILFKRIVVAVGSTGLLLGACNSNPTATPPQATVISSTSPSTIASSPPTPTQTPSIATTDHAKPTQGGQVVEVGQYHLELLAAPENEGLHIDLYLLQGDNHTSVPNATVTANVQLPDGSQQTVSMTYNSSESHYKAYLNSKATGTYKVTVLTNINGEKINGRFGFKR